MIVPRFIKRLGLDKTLGLLQDAWACLIQAMIEVEDLEDIVELLPPCRLCVLREFPRKRDSLPRRKFSSGVFGPYETFFFGSVEAKPRLFIFNDVETLPF